MQMNTGMMEAMISFKATLSLNLMALAADIPLICFVVGIANPLFGSNLFGIFPVEFAHELLSLFVVVAHAHRRMQTIYNLVVLDAAIRVE